MIRPILAVMVLSLPLAPAGAGETACADSPMRVGECFTVHGRLTTCGGVPTARIWVVGTKRVLGVVAANSHPAGDHILPPSLDRAMASEIPCSRAAYGDFAVCPLSPDQPGVMRRVCLTDARKLVFRDW
ncbi:hypothetical protein [Paramagnetospirillum magneticum]|uniref:Secreted protein n=1 Tax=Paramagnetospirillum magneticum (strain ATCC 700264 / AMB-1) TaxID=342108 RepID=Q2WAU4_PARM1|nr:hypothetical protein [Paramagnetospirillum magneticum]BAE49031.1 hypothetical protein amb0227 [Paramagnetospirillum magneticum AMB-1]